MSTVAPQQPAYSPPPPSGRPKNGVGIAALVVGIVAFLLGLIPFLGPLLGLVAIVLGVLGLTRKTGTKAFGVVGLVLGVLALLAGLVTTVFTIGTIGAASQAVAEYDEDLDAIEDGLTAGPSAPAADESAAAEEEPAAEKPAEESDVFADTYGTFGTKKVSGDSDDVIALPEGATAGIVTATYSGDSNFAISGVDADNQSTGELLVNTIGSYKGTTAFGLSALGDTTKFEVTGQGDWTITIRPISAAKDFTSKGKGDQVLKYTGGAQTWTVKHKGDSNFAVIEYSDALIPNLAVNEIGDYEGRVAADAGPAVVVVKADGPWSIK